MKELLNEMLAGLKNFAKKHPFLSAVISIFLIITVYSIAHNAYSDFVESREVARIEAENKVIEDENKAKMAAYQKTPEYKYNSIFSQFGKLINSSDYNTAFTYIEEAKSICPKEYLYKIDSIITKRDVIIKEAIRIKKEVDAIAKANIDKAAKDVAEADINNRISFAENKRQYFLDNNLNIKVNVSGKKKTTITMKYVLFTDVWANKFKDALDEYRVLGFKKLILTDGYDYNVYWNL